jgi:hypothetical protein
MAAAKKYSEGLKAEAAKVVARKQSFAPTYKLQAAV